MAYLIVLLAILAVPFIFFNEAQRLVALIFALASMILIGNVVSIEDQTTVWIIIQGIMLLPLLHVISVEIYCLVKGGDK